MFDVTEGIFLPLRNIIKYYNMDKFRYDNYIGISILKLLLSIIVIDN